MGRPGAPGAPTFKQVIIEKGKMQVEGLNITGSTAAEIRTKESDSILIDRSTNTTKGTARKQEPTIVLPSQEADPQ